MKRLLLFGAIAISISSFSQNVNIPDANFKAYLIGEPSINTNGDSEIQVSEAVAHTGAIYCNDLNISDLGGIEIFTSLTTLYCNDNQLTSLDVSQNIALTQLTCFNNLLTSLDVSQNIALTQLTCFNNLLTSLDVSQNTAFSFLDCRANLLTALDLSQNTVLDYLICDNNQLTSLDLTQNFDLYSLNCSNNNLTCLNVKNGNNTHISYFYVNGNSNLTCIEVDDVSWSTNMWTVLQNEIDAQMSFSTACSTNCALGVTELYHTPKEIIKITDLIGRETEFKANTPLIFVYSDGTIEKVFEVEY